MALRIEYTRSRMRGRAVASRMVPQVRTAGAYERRSVKVSSLREDWRGVE